MDSHLKTLFVDAGTGFYRLQRFRVGDFFGPVDLGLHLAGRYNSLNIGAGLLAGSIFPGSNRLVFTGFSPCWGGFFVSSMGGAALVFDNLGINMVSISSSTRRRSRRNSSTPAGSPARRCARRCGRSSRRTPSS